MAMINCLANHDTELLTVLKCLTVQSAVPSFIKLCMAKFNKYSSKATVLVPGKSHRLILIKVYKAKTYPSKAPFR
jgi:hypothetical protein